MNPALRRRLSVGAFILAATALFAAGAWGIVQRQFDRTIQIALAAGVLLTAAGVLLDPARIRAAFRGRQARYGSNAVLLSLAFTGILVVVSYLAMSSTRQIDLTEDQEFTLTTESQLVLAELQQPVLLLGFFTPESSASREYVRPLMDQYQRAGGDKVSVKYIDPRADPITADQYGVTRDAAVVVAIGDHSEVLSSASEQQITGAIVRLTNPEKRKVYFLSGHGEHQLDATGDAGYSDVQRALENLNYEVASLSLVTGSPVPEDARAVILAGPTADLPASEIAILKQYAANGGSLVILLEPPVATEVTVDDALAPYLASDWGVEARTDLIVDLSSTQPLVAVAEKYGSHAITERLANLVSYFPSARSLAGADTGALQLRQTELVLTGSGSWGKADREAILAGTLEYAEGQDTAGPLTVGMVVEDSVTGARLVVLGDSDFAANSDFSQYANGDLLVNCIDWASHQENLISLTPKQATNRYVTPPTAQAVGLIFLLTVLVIPGSVVAAGVYVWWRRRRQA